MHETAAAVKAPSGRRSSKTTVERRHLLKAAHTDRILSALVNAAVRRALGEDAQDLTTFAECAKEPAL